MRFSIIIPAYNEGAHIERIIREIHEELQKVESDFEIVVVDNGSSDNTQTVLGALQKELPHVCARRVFPNRGYGGGILEGLSVAHGDVVGWTDGDGQVRAEDLGGMYEKMRQENLVFLKARRVTRHDGLFRIIQSNIFNLIFHILFFTLVNDVNAKPKLFRRSFYATIDLVSADMFIDAEIVIKALRSGIQIKEYPIVFESRKEGASKIHIGAGLEFIKNLLYYRFIKL
ncbi:MAG TPA: glycosyltransferase family 2 protein [Candidatus Paceibacterota bacterium]